MAGSSAITVVKAVKNTAVLWADSTVTANDTGFATLDVSTIDGSKVLFLIARTGAKAETLVVKAGSTGNAWDHEFTGPGIGDYSKATTVAGRYIAGPFETARFKDTAGKIKFAASTASTGVISVEAILFA
jgi:hypothetical protein